VDRGKGGKGTSISAATHSLIFSDNTNPDTEYSSGGLWWWIEK